jgi:hypothetical protein
MQDKLKLPKETDDYMKDLLRRTGKKSLSRTKTEQEKILEDYWGKRD